MIQSKRTNLAFLGTQIEIAGAQRMLLSQARWFESRGYAVKAIFFYDKQNLASSWSQDYKIPILNLEGWVPAEPLFLNVFKLIRALARLFAEVRGTQAVIAFTPHSNLLGLPIAWLAGVNTRIGTHHGFIEGSSGVLEWLHGWLTNSWICTVMVAVSAQVRDYAINRERADAKKLVVIENGVEPTLDPFLSQAERAAFRRSLGVKSGNQMVLTVGRLTVQKGHTVLLDAIARQKKNLNAHYIFAGDGPQRALLEEKTQKLGLTEKVVFLGVRNDIPRLLWAADIFAQPSLWEGLSLALLEALFAGVPVLATRVEGAVDVLDESTAVLVPEDDPEALATALDKLIADSDLRERLGGAGRERARSGYSIDNMCKKYEDLIRGLLNVKEN